MSPGGPGSLFPAGGAHRLEEGEASPAWQVRIWEKARLLLWRKTENLWGTPCPVPLVAPAQFSSQSTACWHGGHQQVTHKFLQIIPSRE